MSFMINVTVAISTRAIAPDLNLNDADVSVCVALRTPTDHGSHEIACLFAADHH